MTQSPEGGAPRYRFLLLLACFFLSGLAGLIYQTAWTQQFALVFGTSELALVTVLTAYMAGLALGAAAAGRFAYRLRRPVLTYALLELGIGLAALAVQPAIDLASRLHVALFGGSDLPPEAGAPASALFTFLSSGAILLVPTALMGATLPLLARWAIHREAQIGPRIGALYTANTAGAAAGALVGAFVLLPRFGLGFTVLAGAAVNGLVFALAAVLARGLADGTTEPQDRGSRRWHWILPLILVSGIVSFTWEVLWTRLLTQLVGGSLYAFATMLATFLVGLALGSAWAARAARDAARARTGFIVAQLAIAGLSLAAFALADRLPQLAGRPGGRLELLLYGAVASAATLLPAAVAIGATFPFAVRILAARAEDAAAASARVFAWNTVGAITGAVAAGYLLLPTLGFAGTAQAAAAASLFLALAAALLTQPRRPTLIATAACGLLALLLLRPGNPWTLLRHSPLRTGAVPGEIVGLGVGRSATVLTLERRDGWRIASNGLPEASIEPPWGRPSRDLVTRWLSLLPLLVRPQTSSLLVVGLGAGVTVEDVPASVESIHVVELESEVVRANRQLAAQRWRDPLADPRLSLHTNDARGALRLTGRRFDAIVSQPSHPWTSGASHLFTREFFQLAHDRLTPDGIFVQWMGLGFVDEALLRSLVATALDVFANVEVYRPVGGAVLLLCSPEPFDLRTTALGAIASAPRQWARLGVLSLEDVLVARALDAEGARRFAADAPLNTDFHNLLQTRSPTILQNPLRPANASDLLAPYDPLLSEPSSADATETLYFVRRLIRDRNLPRARRLAESLTDPAARQTALGLVNLAQGRRREAEAALFRALRLAPESPEAAAALLALYQPALRQGQPGPVPAFIEEDPAAAVVAGWRLQSAGHPAGIRDLEQRLAAIEPLHPLFHAAIRMRVDWRIASHEPERAGEALELLDPLLAPTPRPRDLLLRARAGLAAGQPRIALATLEELAPLLQRDSTPEPLRRETRRILRSVPQDEDVADWWEELSKRLE